MPQNACKMHHYEGENQKKIWGENIASSQTRPLLGTAISPPRLDTRAFGARPRLDKFRKSNPGVVRLIMYV